MTSCFTSIFFLGFLCSSISTIDGTGIKVRITSRAQNLLADMALVFMEDLVNKPLPDFTKRWGLAKCSIRKMKITSLTVNPHKVNFRFRPNSGLVFKIQNLHFTGVLQRRVHLFGLRVDRGRTFVRGKRVNTAIGLKLKRNRQGRLKVRIPFCRFDAHKIHTSSSGFVGKVLDFLNWVFPSFLKSKICPAIQTFLVPEVNRLLSKVSMTSRIYGNLNLDYSLTRDVSVMTNAIDIPFRGVVFRQGDYHEPQGTEPFLTETNLMAYIGISDVFFKSFAQAIYGSAPFKLKVPKLSYLENSALNAVGLPVGPAELRLTEVPHVSISSAGLSVKVMAKAKSLVQPRNPALPVVCKVVVKVEVRNDLLMISSNNVKCEVHPTTWAGKIVRVAVGIGISKKVKGVIDSYMGRGLKLPLPDGLDFTEAKIDYHHGFVVVGGNLSLSPVMKQKVMKALGR